MFSNDEAIALGQSNKFYSSFASFPPADQANQNKLYIDSNNGTIYQVIGGAYEPVSSATSGSYLGVWDSNLNSPTIVDSTGANGDFYIVSVAGNTVIDGEGNWEIGDQIRFNGTVWQKIPATVVDNTPIELSGNQTLNQLNTVYLINATASDATVTIPDADATNGGKEIQIIKNSGDFSVIVQTTSGQIIGTLTSQVISETGKGFTAISRDGDNSWVIRQDSRTSNSIKTISSNYTVTVDDKILLANGTFTITLPTTFFSGDIIIVKNIGTGDITLSSTANIDDELTKVITNQYDAFSLAWDGTQWWVY